MLADFHLHTLVSDGELTPEELLAEAARRGVTELAITDHDTLGAYRWRDGVVFREARRLGLALSVGIEMDADLEGVEVHVLGLELSLEDRTLADHIERVRAARRERARLEIGAVNRLLGEEAIREGDVFAPGRETLMKPHFIRPLLRQGRFESYEQANAWYREKVRTGVSVPRPTTAEAIRMIHGAGGWAALAHPGYYEHEGVPDILERLPRLREQGLDGVELDYPYHAHSPRKFSREDERRFIERLRASAAPLGLRGTRGSDAHTAEDFALAYGG